MNNNTKTLNLTADETGRAIVNHMINRLAEQLSPGLGLPFKRVLEMVTAMHQGGNLVMVQRPGDAGLALLPIVDGEVRPSWQP